MPRKAPCLIGKTFGRLIVIGNGHPDKHSHKRSLCRCRCGKTFEVLDADLRNGHTKSCGCYSKDHPSRLVHGHARKGGVTPTFGTWCEMIKRCTNPRSSEYPRYGARGISICKHWMSFSNFLEDMGTRPLGMTIERTNNTLGYSKSNCKWATAKEQARNTRRNRIVCVRGITDCVEALCERFKAKSSRVRYRLSAGWTPEDAFFAPVGFRASHTH